MLIKKYNRKTDTLIACLPIRKAIDGLQNCFSCSSEEMEHIGVAAHVFGLNQSGVNRAMRW